MTNTENQEITTESTSVEDQNTELETTLDTNLAESPKADQIDPVKQPKADQIDSVKQPEPEALTKRQQRDAINYRALREQNEKIAKERDEVARKLREYEQAKQVEKYGMAEEDYSVDLGVDELAEGKHLSKITKHIEKLESKLSQYEQQSSLSNTELRLKSEYSDFDKIVTPDNIKALSATYPELAASLNSNPDIYTKAKGAYTLIKNLGLHIEDTYEPDRAIVQKNLAKPKPLASISSQQGDSPLSRANMFSEGLTENLKAQLRREMDEARKNY